MKRGSKVVGWSAAVVTAAVLGTGSARAADDAATKEAERHFKALCSTCHGADGRGDGPAGKALKPPPANFTDPAFQKSRTDEQLAKTILEGGAAVGKNPAMPPNPQYKSRPEVIKALVAKVRSFGKKKQQ